MKILINPKPIISGGFNNCVGNTDSCGIQTCTIVGCKTNCADNLPGDKEASRAGMDNSIQKKPVCWTYLCTPIHFLPW